MRRLTHAARDRSTHSPSGVRVAVRLDRGEEQNDRAGANGGQQREQWRDEESACDIH
jgi:hypothetical protein